MAYAVYPHQIRPIMDKVRTQLKPEVILSNRVYLCPYPKPYEREIFSVEFFSTEGRNVATWIPDIDVGQGAVMNTLEVNSYRGRVWGFPLPSGFIDMGEEG